MSGAEATYNEMTQQVNRLFEKSKKLEKIAVEKELNAELSAAADQLIKDLKTYDAIMAQRLSKAYDDVENYVNGFTANYIRAFNEADSDQPRVTAGTKKRIGELNTVWQKHKSVADPLEQRLKELEQRLFEAGIGPLSL
jgi:triphosphoribosyl-dephospho-CoA synthetase